MVAWCRVLLPVACLTLAGGLLPVPRALAQRPISVEDLEGPWPHPYVKTLEVGKRAVVWRQALLPDAYAGGVHTAVPTDLETTWALLMDAEAVGQITPGVVAVRYLDRTATHELLELDVAVPVLVTTYRFTLQFEIERQTPTRAVFAMRHPAIGEYRGRLLLTAAGQGTDLDLVTGLTPGVRIPPALFLGLERVIFLRAMRQFLREAEARAPATLEDVPTHPFAPAGVPRRPPGLLREPARRSSREAGPTP